MATVGLMPEHIIRDHLVLVSKIPHKGKEPQGFSGISRLAMQDRWHCIILSEYIDQHLQNAVGIAFLK